MAIVLRMTWPRITPEMYAEVRRRTNWISRPAPGGDVHIASFDLDGTLHCTDVWQSQEALNAFLETRLLPTVQDLGITAVPEILIDDCHECFVPHLNTITLPESDRLVAATPV